MVAVAVLLFKGSLPNTGLFLSLNYKNAFYQLVFYCTYVCNFISISMAYVILKFKVASSSIASEIVVTPNEHISASTTEIKSPNAIISEQDL